jgi:beta-glucosidase
MIETCLQQGITPVVTYNHFTVPRWMAGRGGWSAPNAPARFAEYASRVTQHCGGPLSWACTLNEPNLMAMMRSTGVLAMGAGDRLARPEAIGSEQAGVGGFDPARWLGRVARHNDLD